MQKIKRFKVAVIGFLIVSMLVIYGSAPRANAASLDSAKDTISDSSPSASGVTHTIVFDLGTQLSEGQYVEFTFEDKGGSDKIDLSSATTTCPLNTTASAPSAQVIRCTVDSGQTLASTTAATTTVVDAINPASTGDYSVNITSYTAGNAVIESSQVKIYVISQVTVTAHVDATLSFSIGSTTPADTINTEAFTGTSTATAIAFSTLDPNKPYLMGQTLSVSTNASDGFTVTVQQDGNLQTAAGADINSFATGTPADWSPPAGTIGDDTTWGWMGVTSDDSDAFASQKYEGLDGSNPLTVMSNNGPANGAVTGVGTTQVGYKVQVSALQEAGDYQNTLTYICTPTY